MNQTLVVEGEHVGDDRPAVQEPNAEVIGFTSRQVGQAGRSALVRAAIIDPRKSE